MEQHFGGGTIDDKKLRKRKKRLERLQRQQEKEELNNLTTNHNSSANIDDVHIEDVNDETVKTNDYDFDADLYVDDSDTDSESGSENLNDVDNVLQQAECLLHRRKRPITTTNDADAANKFDEILT